MNPEAIITTLLAAAFLKKPVQEIAVQSIKDVYEAARYYLRKRFGEHSEAAKVLDLAIQNVMAYVPPDAYGLPMNRGAAAILDANDHDDMRRGYRIELFNSRGAYNVAGGQADREKQREYEVRAKKMNDAGFTNIAATLRSMAEEYGYSAERAEKSVDPDL